MRPGAAAGSAVPMDAPAADPYLAHLDRLVGEWRTEATHPFFPGLVVHGTVAARWLDGGHFLEQRSENEHPDFPNALSVIGRMDQDRADQGEDAKDAAPEGEGLRMHYFDSRGVFRIYETSVDEAAWRWERMAPGFSQRFTGTFADDGDTIVGVSQLQRDDADWADDLEITYRRA